MTAPFVCALCGGRESRPLFAVGADRYVRCAGCGLAQMHPRPGDLGPGEDYAGFDLGSYREFLRVFRLPQYERDAAAIRRFREGGRLLDIGCGTGEFLDVARKAGFAPAGIEPSPTAAAIARKAHGVACGELKDAAFPEAHFDVVTLWSVVEHALDPPALLRRAADLLKPGGVLGLRVPDVRGLLPGLALGLFRVSFRRITAPLTVLYQLDWHYKHFFGFDRPTLRRLVESAGFSILELRRENSYSPRSLGLRLGYLPVRGALARALVAGGLGIIAPLARVFGLEDEIVLFARKTGP